MRTIRYFILGIVVGTGLLQVATAHNLHRLFATRQAGATETVSSLTRAGSTATATTSNGHQYITGDLVTIAGADQAAYNGVFQVTVTNNTVFTYTVSGTPATPATGSITSVGPGNVAMPLAAAADGSLNVIVP